MSSYSDVVIVLSYATRCDDLVKEALDRLALEAAAARLLSHASKAVSK